LSKYIFNEFYYFSKPTRFNKQYKKLIENQRNEIHEYKRKTNEQTIKES